MQYISSQFYFTRFLSDAKPDFDFIWAEYSVILLFFSESMKKDIICKFLQSDSVQYVLNVLFTFSIIKGFYI